MAPVNRSEEKSRKEISSLPLWHRAGKKSKGMNEFMDQALNKLAENVSGQKENAMAPSVREALTDFCRQDAEFAQAVAQGGSFEDCMAAVAKGVGGSISDLEAYRKAVRFYFKGADVRFRMEIDLCPTAEEAPRPAVQKKILDIADFL